jgi:hypothetical protein
MPMNVNTDKAIIGRAEKISFPDYGLRGVYAKIDTGADLSSIWASDVHERNGVLKFKLFGQKSKYYTGQQIEVAEPHYLRTRIANSFGHKELRYVVKLQIKLGGKSIVGTFTLSDRSKKTYPILLGRKLLNRKFLVDVSKGTPLKETEEAKKKRLKKEMEVFKMWEKKA